MDIDLGFDQASNFWWMLPTINASSSFQWTRREDMQPGDFLTIRGGWLVG